MKVLVTGGSGALGSEVCHWLRGGGHEAIVFDVAPPREAAAGWFRGDIRDGVALLEAVRTHNPAAIVHLASLLSLETRANPRLGVEINSIGMVNALDAARILGVRRFVWASTAGVFSAGPETVANDAPYRPLDIYGGTKILNETLADHYHRTYGLETIGLRFPAVMGAARPTSQVGMLGEALIEKPVAGEPSAVPFADDVPNWLWIGDAAQAITLATTSTAGPAGNYNIGGDVRPLRDAIAIARDILPGASIEAEPGIAGLEIRLDSSLFEERFGFRPEWRLEDQLAELIRRARARRTGQEEGAQIVPQPAPEA
jgi:nucleoside-diphosphate-sugar epimerase